MKTGKLTARECCARALRFDGASKPPTVVEPDWLEVPLMRLKLEVLL